MGLAIVRWERSVAGVSERGMVGCAAALLASWSALLYVLFAGGGSGASLAGLAGVVSLAVRPRALRPDAQDVVVTRLLTLQTASFLKRYAGAFAASGAVTTFALIQFASARFAVVSDDTFLVLLLVAPVFLLVLLCAWLPKREQNFMLVFHLSFVVALLALFPVNPGTPISLNVSVAFCLLWIGSLVGSLLVMGSRVNRALRPWCDPCGLGPAAFCLGVAAGALVAIGWTMTPDFETVASGSPDGIVKVSVVTSFALIVLFCATNVVLRGSMLRRVEFIARGRITQVMPAPRSFSGSEAHGEGDAHPMRCRMRTGASRSTGGSRRASWTCSWCWGGATRSRACRASWSSPKAPPSRIGGTYTASSTCTASRSFSTSSSATRAHESGEGRSPPTGAASYG